MDEMLLQIKLKKLQKKHMPIHMTAKSEMYGFIAWMLTTCVGLLLSFLSKITLAVAFGFAVSRPRLTLEMVEDAVHFLSKETMVQAIARSATKFDGCSRMVLFFLPNDRSLFMDPDNPPSKLQVVSEWMRPTDIMKEKHLDSPPCLFSGGANSSDVDVCQAVSYIRTLY